MIVRSHLLGTESGPSYRHPGQFDDRRSDDELWNDEVTTPVAGEWAVLEVNTEHPVDVSTVIRDIERLVG